MRAVLACVVAALTWSVVAARARSLRGCYGACALRASLGCLAGATTLAVPGVDGFAVRAVPAVPGLPGLARMLLAVAAAAAALEAARGLALPDAEARAGVGRRLAAMGGIELVLVALFATTPAGTRGAHDLIASMASRPAGAVLDLVYLGVLLATHLAVARAAAAARVQVPVEPLSTALALVVIGAVLGGACDVLGAWAVVAREARQPPIGTDAAPTLASAAVGVMALGILFAGASRGRLLGAWAAAVSLPRLRGLRGVLLAELAVPVAPAQRRRRIGMALDVEGLLYDTVIDLRDALTLLSVQLPAADCPLLAASRQQPGRGAGGDAVAYRLAVLRLRAREAPVPEASRVRLQDRGRGDLLDEAAALDRLARNWSWAGAAVAAAAGARAPDSTTFPR